MMEKFVSEDERAWFISRAGDESEERRSSELSSLGKAQRGFSSLYRTLFQSRKQRGVLEGRLLVDVFAGINNVELGLDQFQLHLILL